MWYHAEDDGAVVEEAGVFLLGWDAEFLMLYEFWAWRDMRKLGVVVRTGQSVVSCVLKGVVAHEVVHNIVPLDANRLFDESTLLERVRVDKRAQQSSFALVAQRSGSACRAGVPILLRVGPAIPLSLDGALLVAGGEILFELAVDQVVAKDSAGAPVLSVRPALDARGGFLVDKHVATADQVFSFSVVGSTRRVHEHARKTGLDDSQRIKGCHDHAMPGGVEHVAWWCRWGGQWLRMRLVLGLPVMPVMVV